MVSLSAVVGAIVVMSAPPARADVLVAQATAAPAMMSPAPAMMSPAPAMMSPAPAMAPAMASPAPSPTPTPTPPPHAFQISGYADAGYQSAQWATNAISQTATYTVPPFPATITGRVFDTVQQQIQFHDFNVTASYSGPIGATVEFNGGDDANVINSYPKSVDAPGTGIDLTQAFLSLNSGQFTGIVGKFETLAGAEVIESPSDLNYSRSILFGYAVPFTHTGGRLTWTPNSEFQLIAGLNNGWDTVHSVSSNGDNNNLTIEGGLKFTKGNLALTIDGYTGNVQEGAAQANTQYTCFAYPAQCNIYAGVPGGVPHRSLLDVVGVYKTGAWLFQYNADFGTQTNTSIYDNVAFQTTPNYEGLEPTGFGTATWSGMAAYVNYTFNSKFSATARAEYLYDGGGSRTGITQRWGEATLTGQYQPAPELIFRAEVRGDRSNQPYFASGGYQPIPLPDGTTGFQIPRYYTNLQYGLEAIVKWP
jgi:hypothetical protein